MTVLSALKSDARASEPLRLRLRFSKRGKVRFTSHRDVARIWERALRRAGVPVAYSAGFARRPRISFGLALPTCYESDAEYLDVMLDQSRPAPACRHAEADALSEALPRGMSVLASARLPGRRPSLQHAVTSCTWWIDATGAGSQLASDALDRALASDVLLVERKRKGRVRTDDIRPSILAARVDGDTIDGVRLVAELGTQPRATRPTELLASLNPPLRELRVRRLHQWITTDAGERREPLAAAGLSVAGSAAATVRAPIRHKKEHHDERSSGRRGLWEGTRRPSEQALRQT